MIVLEQITTRLAQITDECRREGVSLLLLWQAYSAELLEIQKMLTTGGKERKEKVLTTVEKIGSLLSTNTEQAEIAQRLGVSQAYVSQIKKELQNDKRI